jgi:putative aldouronate transport system permease protein
MGWGTIIYLAAIAGINPEIYEAATVDGANRVQRIWHIILPSILSTITILFILAVGNAMNAGFEQIFNMYSAPVYSVADIIDTFIYRQSFTGSGSFSLSTAAGLFKSIINFSLIFAADRACRALGQQGLY